MNRWDCNRKDNVEDKNIDNFLVEIFKVCEKHGYSIAHEDVKGGFLITKYNDYDVKWLNDAMIDII